MGERALKCDAYKQKTKIFLVIFFGMNIRISKISGKGFLGKGAAVGKWVIELITSRLL